jgi:hypothetical protein
MEVLKFEVDKILNYRYNISMKINNRKTVNVNDLKVRLVVNKEYSVIGGYRGKDDVYNKLVGNGKRCCMVDGINGDGCDEYVFSEGIDDVVKKGVDVGLWEVYGSWLKVVNEDRWNVFFDVVVY